MSETDSCQQNPYSAGRAKLPLEPIGLMTFGTVRFILTVAGVGLLIGGVGGFLLAMMMPEYYQHVFGDRFVEQNGVVRVAVGLGAMQGFGAGVCLGTVLAIAEAWLKLKRSLPNRQQW